MEGHTDSCRGGTSLTVGDMLVSIACLKLIDQHRESRNLLVLNVW